MTTNLRSLRSRKGYSLVELLVVIAIIGMISVVSVPQFMKMYRSNKMKSVARNFTTNVRGVRQKAISENRRTRVTFTLNDRTYRIWAETMNPTTGVKTWTPHGPLRYLEDQGVSTDSGAAVRFGAVTGFESTTGGMNHVIFNPNGTIDNLPATNPFVPIITSDNIPKASYEVTFGPSGQITLY